MRDDSGVAEAFRDEWPRLVATLVKGLGDLDLAEESAQDAFTEAAARWRIDGRPDRPGAWLLTTARRKAIDHIRRDARYAQRRAELEARAARADTNHESSALVDDQLALLIGCCHPALNVDAQVALTLRVVAGLTTDQIARAFLVSPSTMGRRLSRAKTKIREARIPFTTPERSTLVERLGAVRRVTYLIFTEGHTSATATSLVRGDLCDEAVWLAELLADLVPDDAEVRGLAALVLLSDARRATRSDDGGRPVLLADQDRSQWDQDMIARGLVHLGAAHARHSVGPFQLQAAIAALHATASSFDGTDWPAIVRLYDALLLREPSAIVALNRAVAVSYADGPAVGLSLVEVLGDHEELADYPYFHSTRAELMARSGRLNDAVESFDVALRLCTNEAERLHLEHRRAVLVGDV